MLNHTETASMSTIVSLPPVSQSQRQQGTAHHVSSTPSYAIGPIDPRPLLTLQAHLSDDTDITLLVPARLSPPLLCDPEWKHGYEWGYLEGGMEEKWTIPRIVNRIALTLYTVHTELSDEPSSSMHAWVVGFLLGDLANLAETERTLALVGIAHLDFLLSHISLDTLSSRSYRDWREINALHNKTLHAYRARAHNARAQGASWPEAQRIALVGNVQ